MGGSGRWRWAYLRESYCKKVDEMVRCGGKSQEWSAVRAGRTEMDKNGGVE